MPGRILLMVCVLAVTTACTHGAGKFPEDVRMQLNDNRTIRFLKGDSLSASLETGKNFRKMQEENRFADIALAFVTAHRQVFLLENPPAELRLVSENQDDTGMKHLKFAQMFKNVPVRGGEILIHLNRKNQVVLVQGSYISTPEKLDIAPGINGDDAVTRAAKHLGVALNQCTNCRASLVIMTTGPCLAWDAVISSGPGSVQHVFVDARSGKILEILSGIQH